MIKIIQIILVIALTFSATALKVLADTEIKLGLLVPLTGKNYEIGQSIIKSIRLAINKINNPLIDIVPKDTRSNPETTLKVAKELADSGIKRIIAGSKFWGL